VILGQENSRAGHAHMSKYIMSMGTMGMDNAQCINRFLGPRGVEGSLLCTLFPVYKADSSSGSFRTYLGSD
jgi:hypothetical protein